jgi:hypothetical protein
MLALHSIDAVVLVDSELLLINFFIVSVATPILSPFKAILKEDTFFRDDEVALSIYLLASLTLIPCFSKCGF